MDYKVFGQAVFIFHVKLTDYQRKKVFGARLCDRISSFVYKLIGNVLDKIGYLADVLMRYGYFYYCRCYKTDWFGFDFPSYQSFILFLNVYGSPLSYMCERSDTQSTSGEVMPFE